ncbi:hypothetical protein CASFOL_035639 [Castilleja foliolosa]|uniref:Uncharacterized protein n=1 Tax=Castilleja foliolosa TaxID=1961234 RepID=A0ABD3BTX0_9LAMI
MVAVDVMAENFEGVLEQKWRRYDLENLISQLSDHESLLRLKRRWLMDLPLSNREQKRVEKMLPPNDMVLPESLIREDDVSYEDIRTCIETGFGVRKRETKCDYSQDDLQVFNSHHCFEDICFLLDDMTNKGLFSLTKALTGGSTKFEKTNLIMKRTIKEYLLKVIIAAKNNDISETKLKQVFQLLKDPNNFSEPHMMGSTTTLEAYRAAAINVLDVLGDLPTKAIITMHQKLRGLMDHVPSLIRPKYGYKRKKLIKLVKNKCMEMLSSLGEQDEPSEQLTGALVVASLTLKLIMNRTDVMDLRKFSPEIESLQNDIAKSIHLINNLKGVSLIELKKVQLLVDPSFKLSDRNLRAAVRNLLTEYLYECGDMDKVPDSLVKIINIINRKSHQKESSLSPKELMQEVIQKEVEHVLIVSAQAKQVVLDSLTQHGFDNDFVHAYMEDFEVSDAICVSDFDEKVGNFSEHYDENSCDSYGYNSPNPASPLCSSNGELMDSKAVDEQCTARQKFSGQGGVKSEETTSCSAETPNCVSPLEETNIACQHSNQYLEAQEACDATAMVAYRFVGNLLDKLAKIEGLELHHGARLYLQSHSSDHEDYQANLQFHCPHLGSLKCGKNVIEG